MDTGYLIELASLLLRWLHLVTGIAWIGASFYFIWLDNSLKPPVDPELQKKGVGGELWAVHGGGFYNPQKYSVAPKNLPEELHWFKWEAYSTFITGFLLITVLYYFQASIYMVDPNVSPISSSTAVWIGIGTLVLGYVIYDVLARLLIQRSQLVFAVVYGLFVVAVTYGLTHLLSGRAAFIHVGAMIGTTMAANVFFWIIPGQRSMVDAMKKGQAPNAQDGKRGKQRSVHNNYLTLPVLFCMISNHYAFTYSHPHAWAVLSLIMIAAVLIRHFFNLHHKGQLRLEFPIAGAAILLLVFIWVAPSPAPMPVATAPAAAGDPHAGMAMAPVAALTVADIRPIIDARCTACHAAKPTMMPSAPAGVMLDTPERISAQASKVYAQVVTLKAMPLGNVTAMTDDERAKLAAWFQGGAKP
ncbi:MAG: urate hydroxylase PuuD [Rhodocyclaceae bacterium]